MNNSRWAAAFRCKFSRRYVLMVMIAAASGYAADRSADSGSVAPTQAGAGAELSRIEAADDAAQAEVDAWVAHNKALKAQGTAVSDEELERRIAQRFEPVRRAYDEFLRRHPADARAHLIYGDFLNARQDEHGAQVQWEKALELDPTNPAVYNNLAGRYSESGPVNKAFEFFAKAIQLAPAEPVYYHNFADCLYVLRKPASAYFQISEQQVFAKALLLYSNALRLDPRNFNFAHDWAQTFYSLKPFPVSSAFNAWTNALSIAREDADRQDVLVHLARVNMLAGRLAEARAQLQVVTNAAALQAKAALLRAIEQRAGESTTNRLAHPAP